MIVLLRSTNRISKLGKKLILLLVTFSSAITLVITGIQLFMDYRVQRDQVETLLERMSILFPPIAAQVWSFDDAQIQLSLDSLAHLPNIERVTVTATDHGTRWTAQSGHSTRQIIRTYPLVYKVKGDDRQIATMEIAAGLDEVYGTLVWQGVTILFSNSIKTFCVVLFIYWVFRQLVTVRIEELDRRVQGLVPHLSNDHQMTPVGLDDRPAHGDELDAVRWAFDDMADRLKLLVLDLNARNQQLAAENRERVRAEMELRETVEKLSRAMVEIERFAYVAAHDLKEPIRSIVSFSQMLDKGYADRLGDEGRELLGFLIQGARHMSSLITDLLDYGACERRRMAVGTVDCNRIVGEIVAGLAALIEQKHAEIVVGPLPVLQADPGQLYQLFHNLLANALKFSRDDRPPRVTVSAERVEDGWLLRVADNGIGIDPQYRDYIFEVFRRLHTRDTFPGTGIGLSICKRVVENHDGRIWLENGNTDGATFCILLP
ncbi:Sensor kinase silS [Magnetospirillum sp. LM-5]|uniref:sensor histidine kinase n=1 Tax=Magnetospirillum sp. LM-5 TaxID=2681466 RepID=UPI00137F9E7D|nr:ATP-binding protein [Magnetospirillum sp. LM-5]CAA7611596.1 Sensor kinase silS [Magnetospirillum sp. LM-5]